MFNPNEPAKLSTGEVVKLLIKNINNGVSELGYIAVYEDKFSNIDVTCRFYADGRSFNNKSIYLENTPTIKRTYTNFYANSEEGPAWSTLKKSQEFRLKSNKVVFTLEKTYIAEQLVSAVVLEP